MFGVKGGAAGGGRAQIAPMEDINLHFTGDMHAIGAAHNLLAAMLDNHLSQGNALGLDTRRILWKRVLDMNDRALRNIVLGLGGTAHGVPREGGFEITVASEVMAILCLARDLAGLQGARRAHHRRRDGATATLVEARELKAAGAMAVLMKDAIKPNLVQTLEGTPAFVHGGPFGNIAHGCNSLIATRLALKLGEIVVTEAGFASDLGAEKFVDIKCRTGGLDAGRGGGRGHRARAQAARRRGAGRSRARGRGGGAARHREPGQARGERAARSGSRRWSRSTTSRATPRPRWRRCSTSAAAGACGPRSRAAGSWAAPATTELAEAVLRRDGRRADRGAVPAALSRRVAARAEDRDDRHPALRRRRACGVAPAAAAKLARWEALGYGRLPVCMAKTQNSLSDDAKKLGRPRGFTVTVRDAKLAAGAGFVVAYAGDILTMPGLPKAPGAETMDIDADGNVTGCFDRCRFRRVARAAGRQRPLGSARDYPLRQARSEVRVFTIEPRNLRSTVAPPPTPRAGPRGRARRARSVGQARSLVSGRVTTPLMRQRPPSSTISYTASMVWPLVPRTRTNR